MVEKIATNLQLINAVSLAIAMSTIDLNKGGGCCCVGNLLLIHLRLMIITDNLGVIMQVAVVMGG